MWHQQWQQDLYAQSLLNNENEQKDDMQECTEESDIQTLIQKFPHVDESVIYITYFEQTNPKGDMQQAIALLSVQFPQDPAFQKKEEEKGK